MSDERDRDEADVVELRALFERTRPGDAVWEAPPEELWERIALAIERDPATEPADATAGQLASDSVVVPVAGRRRRRSLAIIVAAAAAVVVAVTVAVLVAGGDDNARVVAAVELERLGASGTGRAKLLDRDGSFQVRLETDGLDPTGGYLELWLLDPTATKLVSLGPLRADGVYDVPAGVDPGEFPVVDISVEPVDGDPTHSGQSVLRGELVL